VGLRLVRAFSPSAVPGELQTETYARLIMADGGNPHDDARAILTGVADRYRRMR
jgi:hypothetical protein